MLIVFSAVCAVAQTRTLGLYMGPARGLDAESRMVMQEELGWLLAPAGIEIAWKDSAARKSGDDFELIAVSSFAGSCSLEGVPQISPGASLADTSISDGQVLPFGGGPEGGPPQDLAGQGEKGIPEEPRTIQCQLYYRIDRVPGNPPDQAQEQPCARPVPVVKDSQPHPQTLRASRACLHRGHAVRHRQRPRP